MIETTNPTHYLVIDLEATCDDKGAFPRSEMEIIEIGTHHRGIDDARNIARLLPWILGRVPLA